MFHVEHYLVLRRGVEKSRDMFHVEHYLVLRRVVEKSRDMFHVEHFVCLGVSILHCEVCTCIFPLGITSASEFNELACRKE